MMVKSELARRIAVQKPQLYVHDVEKIINTILEEISLALAQGKRVELRDFGIFSVRSRAARTGRNPRTGVEVPISPKMHPFFKCGLEIRNRLNRPKAHARI